jgi:hypothetical protein
MINLNARRAAGALAVAMLVAFPLAAFEMAPAAHADGSPGANLAGENATAVATGVELAPLTPGVVGAGNISKGNLIDASVPYAAASTSTGPSSSATASPAYPGSTAAQAGTDIETFSSQFPTALANALNDPVQAQADYPPQLSVGSSSSYNPPAGSTTGVGTARADATDSGASASSQASAESISPALSVASGLTSATTELQSSSVTSTAHSEIGTVKLLGGLVTISGLTSDATATSDGTAGQPTTDFKIGSVTVGGQAAYIGPDGIHLGPTSQGSLLVPAANAALSALAQAGIEVRTISPQTENDGPLATATSGALQITFLDQHIPNPQGAVPVSTIGLDVYLGLSQASADATALPPFAPVGGLGTTGGAPVGTSTSAAVGSSAPLGGAVPSVGALPSPAQPLGSGQTAAPASSATTPPFAPQQVTLLGLPVRVAWVVIAILLSIVASGPLLGYANWQLLGRRRT